MAIHSKFSAGGQWINVSVILKCNKYGPGKHLIDQVKGQGSLIFMGDTAWVTE